MNKFALVAAVVVSASFASAQRAPTVSFLTSGSANNWTLDFNVTNNFLQGEGQLYFFGVRLETGRNIAGDPANGLWDSNAWTSWTNTAYGGSSIVYNNNWIDFSYPTGTIFEGTSMNGFRATYTGATAPTQVQFFAFAVGGTYGGNDNFNNQSNPGFEGVAGPVPEPASMAVLGLGAAALLRRRRK